MKRMGLAALLKPLSTQRFLSEYWQKKPYISHGAPERFKELVQIPELQSIDAILGAWGGQADAWAPRDRKDPVITAEARQLPAFFESGYTLYLSNVEQYVPSLEPLARKMELDLGLRNNDVYFEAFVSKGAGSAVHFDPNVTINIQLIGSKRWMVAENKHVINPHMGWSVGTSVDEKMASYSKQPFPIRMPPSAASFEAKPGTLVYLHPGYWHSTENHEPSLSLLYTINPPSWTDLLVEEIRYHLQSIEESRELAFGLGTTANGQHKKQRLQRLIQAMGEMTMQLSADDLLNEWGGTLSTAFEHNPHVKYKTQITGIGADKSVTLTAQTKHGKQTIELAMEGVVALDWIKAQKKTFYGHQLATGIDCSSLSSAMELLSLFESVGVIERRM
jgi:50S ribosomal protein L16 3-hydroxylase